MTTQIRLALRALRRAPAFAITATITLALGLAVNTVVFSAVNGLLWRPLPVDDPASLMRIGESVEDESIRPLSWPEYGAVRAGVPALAGVVAARANQAILRVGDAAREAMIEAVSSNYFEVLGVRPLVGRGFLDGEDAVPGAPALVVLGERIWRAELGGEADVVGRVVRINGQPFEVVGVMPESFSGTFTGFRVDAWVSVSMMAIALPRDGSIDRIEDRFLTVIGRLAPGATEVRVAQQVEARIVAVRREAGVADREFRVHLASAAGVLPAVANALHPFLMTLLALVGIVLLIACANVANLLIARSFQRRAEFWLRSALGASLWSLIRTSLLEGVLLAAAASVIAWLCAWWFVGLLRAAPIDVGLPLAPDIQLDVRVSLYVLALVVVAILGSSVVPSILSARGSRGTTPHLRSSSSPRSRLRSGLVVVQVALSSLLVAGAVLVMRGLRTARATDPGFDSSEVIVASGDPSQLGYGTEQGRAFWNRLLSDVRAHAGVVDASLALMVPLGGRSDQMRISAAGAPTGSGSFRHYEIVAPDWFRVLRIPLLAGRDVSERDVEGAEPIAIVSRSFAGALWPDIAPADVLGRELRVTDRAGEDRVVLVAGVVEDIAYRSTTEPSHPLVYLPFGQWYRPDMVLHVRSRGDASHVVTAVREIARRLEPELPFGIEAMESEMAVTLVPLRVASVVLGVAGAAGWVLATVGLFGLIAYATSQRGREIAVRLALGARREIVLWSVVRGGLTLTTIGLIPGLAVAAVLARLLIGVVPGLEMPGPVPFLVLVVLFLAITAVASLGPAHRASTTDPAWVLRQD